MRPGRWTACLVTLGLCCGLAGCLLNRAEPRRDASASGSSGGPSLGRIGVNGQVIQPKWVTLKIHILARQLHDPLVNSAVWGQADEQVVAPELRRDLAANGLRVGLLTGGIPAEVEAAINAPPPHKVTPVVVQLPDGERSPISLSDPTPTATVLMSQHGHATARDFKDASGWIRVTATQEGPTTVALRLVPEIHHGTVLRRYDSLSINSAPNALNPMQFMVKDGQQEDAIRDLVATLSVHPGQVAVIGCDPDRRGNLGAFLFTQPEAKSDRLTQKVLLISASRTNLGDPGSQPKTPASLVAVDPFETAASSGEPSKDNEKEKDREKK